MIIKIIIVICCTAFVACNNNPVTSKNEKNRESEKTNQVKIASSNAGDYIIEKYTMQDLVTKINALETTCTQPQWDECLHIAKSYLEKYKDASAASKEMYSDDVDKINKSIAEINSNDIKKFTNGEAGLKDSKCQAASIILYIVITKRVTYIDRKTK